MAVKKKTARKDHLTFMEEVSVFLEKTRLAEYMDLMQRPHRLAWLNFWGGIWRGFGYGVGLFVMIAVFAWGLRVAYHHSGGLPWVGNQIQDLIGWLLKVIDNKRQGNG